MENTSTPSPHRDKQEHTMAHQEHEQRSLARVAGRFVAVNNYLFTPPENVMDSFSSQDQDQDKMDVSTEWRNTLPPIHVHTPPASPEAKSLPNIETVTGYSSSHDSPLYPDEQTDDADSQTPLFRRERSHSPPPVSEESPKPAEPSTHTSQEQSDIFPAILGIRNAEQALQYWHSRVNELRNFHAARLPEPRRAPVRDRDAVSQSQLQRISTRPAGVSKPARPAPKAVSRPKAAVAAASPDKPSPPSKRRTPKARTLHDFVDSAFPSAQQSSKHKRAPPSKKVEGENVSWIELPNFAPPTSSLDSNPKSLKASWNGNPVDLSKDPDREDLHPQEVAVAATLRLSCGQYMSNKRKIFQARVQSIRDGKNFTKTAAQGACSIDVNKASQLWEAFDRVGWFKEAWFEQYL